MCDLFNGVSCQCNRHRDRITAALKTCKIIPSQLEELACDRARWRRVHIDVVEAVIIYRKKRIGILFWYPLCLLLFVLLSLSGTFYMSVDFLPT